MIVAFMSVDESPKYANVMVSALNNAMPGVEIVQLTDMNTPAVDGTTPIRSDRKFDNLTIFRMDHLSRLDGDVLCIDTDVIVQKDMSPVFAFDFDVALTWRSELIHDPNGVNITILMPFNTGVIFSRNPFFWEEAVRFVIDKDIGWYSDQIAVASLSNHFNVLKLHCDNFNYTPKNEDDNLSARYAVHYKGKARKFMNIKYDLIGK